MQFWRGCTRKRGCTEEKYIIAILIVSPLELEQIVIDERNQITPMESKLKVFSVNQVKQMHTLIFYPRVSLAPSDMFCMETECLFSLVSLSYLWAYLVSIWHMKYNSSIAFRFKIRYKITYLFCCFAVWQKIQYLIPHQTFINGPQNALELMMNQLSSNWALIDLSLATSYVSKEIG